MHIRKIVATDCGPFEEAVFELPDCHGSGGLVLFEGPNGSGKTTLLEGLACAIAGPEATSLAQVLNGMAKPQREQWVKMVGDQPQSPFNLWAPVSRTGARVRGKVPRIAFTLANGQESEVTIEIDQSRSLVTGHPPREFTQFQRGHANEAPLSWAAFAYAGTGPDASLDAEGPGELSISPLRGALSFGQRGSNAAMLGKFLMNLDYERARAFQQSQREPDEGRRTEQIQRVQATDETIDRIESSLSRLLDRRVRIEFPVEQLFPRALFDGEEIPVSQLGEGMRRTFSWVTDLLVRLQRIRWADPSRSPVDQEFWLLLDEVDESLHPTMQLRLLPALRQLFPNAMIYAATHSPFVVASVGEGWVFPIRPDANTHRVQGSVERVELVPGRSLEWVVEEVFAAPATFVDAPTNDRMKRHRVAVDELRRGNEIDWPAFAADREWLLALNAEVTAMVLFREAPVREKIESRLP
jgi:hypothetical protein